MLGHAAAQHLQQGLRQGLCASQLLLLETQQGTWQTLSRTLSTAPAQQQVPASTSGSIKPPNLRSSQPTAGPTWVDHTHTQFSIRPSLLSPTYYAYNQEQQRHNRRDLVSRLLQAHTLLSKELDGYDSHQIEQTAQHRASSLRQLSAELTTLAPRPNLPTCTDRQTMVGFFHLLEQQAKQSSHASSPTDASTAEESNRHPAADDAEVYRSVAVGKASVWDVWSSQFASRYAGTPSLEPLEAIYSGIMPAAGTAATAQRLKTAHIKTEPGSKFGARMDITGTVMAEGKRKSSVAKVVLSTGVGMITVNGMPYDAAFRDIQHRAHLVQPLLVAPMAAQGLNVAVTVEGGGISSRAQAARTGLARAMLLHPVVLNRSQTWQLQQLAVWDGRKAERMKPGRAKARAGFTWVRR